MPPEATLVLRNARVGGGREVAAVVVRDGRIAAIQPEPAQGLPAGPSWDVAGCRVLPSFVDAHVHLREWALGRTRVRLPGEPRIARWAEAAREQAARLPPGAWVLGGGWDKNLMGSLPTARDLGGIDRPVMLDAKDGHALWCNDVALRLAGIDAGTPDPPGGRLVRDAAGRPTGVLYENARRPVQALVPADDAAVVTAAVEAALQELGRLGIGEIHDCSYRMADGAGDVLGALDATGRLALRTAVAVPGDALDEAIAAGRRSGQGSAWLRTGALKQLADGTLGSQTAAMEAPYCGSAELGIMCIPPDELARNVARAAAAGLASWIHCIGDRCLREALAALSAAPSPGAALPHRIEHAQLTPPHLLARTAALQVTLSVQPTHLLADMDLARRYWTDRTRDAYAYGSMAEAGVALCFGSDMPVEEPDPMASIRAAVLRQRLDGSPAGGFHAEQRMTPAAALRAATTGGADAGPWRGEKGRLAPGQLADLLVLDPDPLDVTPEELGRCRVLRHLAGGRDLVPLP